MRFPNISVPNYRKIALFFVFLFSIIHYGGTLSYRVGSSLGGVFVVYLAFGFGRFVGGKLDVLQYLPTANLRTISLISIVFSLLSIGSFTGPAGVYIWSFAFFSLLFLIIKGLYRKFGSAIESEVS